MVVALRAALFRVGVAVLVGARVVDVCCLWDRASARETSKREAAPYLVGSGAEAGRSIRGNGRNGEGAPTDQTLDRPSVTPERRKPFP